MQEGPQRRMKSVKKVPASGAGKLDFLSGPGEMARRIRQYDWADTDLGPPQAWPMPLKTLVGLMLSSVQPMFMAWGTRQTWLYNDAFVPILGNKHPGALGRPALGEVWVEAADALEPLFAKVFGGEPVHMEDFAVTLNRRGRLEEAHFTYSYTPVRGDNGDVVALFGACQEITERTLAERQRLEEQERQRRAFEQAPGFVIVMQGPEHTVEFVNNAHRALFASHDWKGKTIRKAFPGLADRGFFERLDAVYATGEPFEAREAEARYRTSSGSPEETRYLDFIYAPLIDEHGAVTGIFCEGFDVTESRQAQQALIASQAELLQLNRTLSEAERALREREAELVGIQQIARVAGVVVHLGDGFRNGFRSPEYREIHGLPPDTEDSHEDWVQRIHPEDRARTLKRFTEAVSGKAEKFSSEYRIIRPDNGQVRWIATEARIERDAIGKPLRLVGAHIDITDRSMARETLRESEERFQLIANSAPVPMWVSNSDGTRAFANQAYLEFLGVGYDEALVFDWRKILHPEDLTRIVQESVAGEASQRLFSLEARYRRAGGQYRWMHSESQPRWDPAGNHIGFIGVAHDVTAAKEAENDLRRLNESLELRIEERTAQLAANETQLRAIFETTNQYQALLDLDGNIVYANSTALAGIRASQRDVTGKPFWEASWFSATEGMRDTVRNAFLAAVRGEIVRTETLLHLPVGQRYFDFAMRPMFDQDSKLSGVLSEAIDITERRKAEEALRQAQKMEAVGQLTGGVAHDFNNLLTIIRSATDFLRRRELSDERRRRYIDAISDTVDRASKLTGQLLAFARRQPLTPQVFDVGAQVESIAQLIRPLVGGRIRIELDLCKPACFAMADVAQFETALVNLAVNGRDAMEGEGQLSIEIKSVDAIPAAGSLGPRAGRFIAVAASDTGSGIAADQMQVIFEPFFTTKEVGKGTGLGLSQAFGFVKQSGGEILVTSELGKGSTFTIYLPQVDPPDAKPEKEAGLEIPASGRGNCVLVVEDNEEVGRFSTELLQDLGYQIDWVGDADAALKALADNELAYDLVFSDVIMPGMNGVDLALTIRERHPGLPVVLTSGYSSVLAQNADRGFELIQKPYSVEALSRILRRAILEKRRV
jgi:PAS domain S-box-containing protein